MDDRSALLTVPEVARLLRVRESTIYTWVETGALPTVRVGRLLRFERAEIDAWLDRRSTAIRRAVREPGAAR